MLLHKIDPLRTLQSHWASPTRPQSISCQSNSSPPQWSMRVSEGNIIHVSCAFSELPCRHQEIDPSRGYRVMAETRFPSCWLERKCLLCPRINCVAVGHWRSLRPLAGPATPRLEANQARQGTLTLASRACVLMVCRCPCAYGEQCPRRQEERST
jgi:hypothetical protein